MEKTFFLEVLDWLYAFKLGNVHFYYKVDRTEKCTFPKGYKRRIRKLIKCKYVD